ncbi:MAG: type II CRISPR RNA-guided endonuclease Cas9 [Porticoccaceae bacterium]
MMLSTPQVPTYTLGLDIGIASVGAALLGEDRIIGLHVRTFDRAETAKEGESLNKIRRESRLTRRRIQRRAHRLLRLRRLFKRQGMIPTADTSSFSHTLSPWQLRAEGLDRSLDSREWAAALYHIIKHRGFHSSRKSEAKADEKTGQMLSGVNANQRKLRESGYRTVGELAALHPDFARVKRNKGGDYGHTFARSDLEAELHILFELQRAHGNPHASTELEKAIHILLMQRRQTLSGAGLLDMVGRCTFEPGEYRSPKASYSAEQFVWLTRMNNLRLSGIGETRALSQEERQLLISMPFEQTKLTYKQVRTKLGIPEHLRFVGLRYPRQAEEGKDPEIGTLFEAKAYHSLRLAYERAGLKLEWQRDGQNPSRLNELAYALTVFKDDSEARQWLTEQKIEPAIIEAVLTESFSDFIRLSAKALTNILPHMEQGKRYDEAVQLAGYFHHSNLPRPAKSHYIPRFGRDFVTNPVVARALNQARKLVNAIVREYGSPAAVHIELARDLSKPFEERRKIQKEQEGYQKTRLDDITHFEENFGFIPKGIHLAKWRLYREQSGKCAYSQKPLDTHRLFEDGYTEIDHALPYSRSFNDGMNNKVLVLTAENRNKGNQTPYEYLGGAEDSELWHTFVVWVNSNKNYREGKRRNLLRKDFGGEAASEFRDRHLNDTRYIAREFKHLVETHLELAGHNGDSQRCVVISGQLTAYLRNRWGLNKNRQEGDLHHALDAAVVAACSRGMVKRLSDYSRRGELEFARGQFCDPETGEIIDLLSLRTLERHFPQPWDHFREELLAWLSPNPTERLARLDTYTPDLLQCIRPVRVSRAPTRRGLGAAHQETIRSVKYLEQGKSTVKTPLEKLSLKSLPDMVGYDDPRNRQLIDLLESRLKQHGDDGKKAFKEPIYKPTRNGTLGSIIRAIKMFTVQKSGLLVRNGIANNGDMIRADIFKVGKNFRVVPLYASDVVKAVLPNLAVVAYKPKTEWTSMEENSTFLFSLYPNDWVRITLKNNEPKEGYYAGLNISTGAMSMWTHDRNQSGGKRAFIEGIGIKTAVNVEKFHVDLLGNLHKVHQETRQPLKPRR